MLTIKIHYSRHFPSLFLLSSSYQSRIDPVSIPYRNTETIRKQYGIDTGAIRKWGEKHGRNMEMLIFVAM